MKTLGLISIFALIVGCSLYQSEGRKAVEEGSISLQKSSTFSPSSYSEYCASTNNISFLFPYEKAAGIYTDTGMYEVYDLVTKNDQFVVVTRDQNNEVLYCKYTFNKGNHIKTLDLWEALIEDAQESLLEPQKLEQ